MKLRKLGKVRQALLVCAILLIVCIVTGCRTVSFYTQAARGQFQLIAARMPISKLLADTNTPARLRQRFETLEDLRAFAQKDLSLPVDGHYKTYADLHRRFVVWNVEAAPDLSMTPRRWWYPLIGRQKYRGYFSNQGATNYAAYLFKKGDDVFVGGVEAYSTLGWFKDIALNTFIYNEDSDLAELIFHELSHQQVFARGDTDFNEAFATTVGQEGARRWLKARRPPEALQAYETELAHDRAFVALIDQTRRELENLFGDQRDEDGELKPNRQQNRDLPELRRKKEQVYSRLLENYRKLKESWGGDDSYDGWFTHQLNNAKLNSVAAYHDLVPGFRALLDLKKGDLKSFYEAAQKLAEMPKKERRNWLHTLDISQAEAPSGNGQSSPPTNRETR